MEPGDVGGATRFEHRFVVTHVEGCAVNRSFGLPSRLWLGEAVRLLPKRPAVAQRQAERAKAVPRSLARRPRPTPLCRSLPGGFYGGIFVGPDRILSLGGRLVRLHPKNRHCVAVRRVDLGPKMRFCFVCLLSRLSSNRTGNCVGIGPAFCAVRQATKNRHVRLVRKFTTAA